MQQDIAFKSHYRLLQITYGRSTNIYNIIIDYGDRFSYTTLLPVLTNKAFQESEIFGIAMTMCAIGGIIATLVLPKVLKYIAW